MRYSLQVCLFSFFLLFLLNGLLSGQEFSTLKHPYRYLPGISAPDPDWMMPDYDDSAWGIDTGRIGYGYGEEDIPVSTDARSLYLRCRLNVENKSDFSEVNFFADYDDGYIAYLNGKEILRVNLDDSIVHPAWNTLANRSHEIQLYGWDYEAILGYYLDSLLLDSCLVEGENIIAIQVFNDSVNGSDLQFLLRFYNISDYDYDIYTMPSHFKRQYNPDSTSLPLVWIETDGYGIPHHHYRRTAMMGIIDRGEGKYNHPDDSCNIYCGLVSIEVRGQSSSDFPKRSYRFELIDSAGIDSSVSLLGMPAEDDWILLGPFHDKALFRNPMVFDMGRRLNGSYQPRNRFCEVFLNGEYVGVYSLLETIKRDDDRVDIARLRPEEISGNDLTGGYILRFDKPYGDLQIVYPKKDDLQPQQEEYIFAYYEAYRENLRTAYWPDPQTGFRRFLNDTSLVDYVIVNEITKNADSYLFSTYLFKDRDDRDPRFHFGPLWDMNLAFGNSLFHAGDRYDEWQFDVNKKLLLHKLFQDTALVHLFQERWFDAREGVFHTDSLLAYIDSMVVFLEESRIRNYTVWPVIDKDIFHPNYRSMSYEEEISNIKNWLVNRLDWMDANIGDIYYPLVMPDLLPGAMEEIELSYMVYPNPFQDEIMIEVNTPRDIDIQFSLYNLMGEMIYSIEETSIAGISQIVLNDDRIRQLTPGIYLLKVDVAGQPFATQRIIKQ